MFCCWYYLFLFVGLFSVGSFLYTLSKAIYRNLLRKPLDFEERYGKGSWAFVTGATSGIGLAMCKDLAGKGFNIVLAGRSKEKLKIAEKEVKDTCKNIKTRGVIFDLNESNEIRYFDKIYAQVEDLDISIFINNAGVLKN